VLALRSGGESSFGWSDEDGVGFARDRDAHNQCNRNRPIDFDYYKIAPSDSD
jgi:hypothetical protein